MTAPPRAAVNSRLELKIELALTGNVLGASKRGSEELPLLFASVNDRHGAVTEPLGVPEKPASTYCIAVRFPNARAGPEAVG